jgi:predicted enzyme related to lactoylglutathione lyase
MTTGRFVWQRLVTTDAEAASRFYADLFGWEILPSDQGAFGTVLLASVNGTPFAHIAQAGDPDLTSHWLPSITIAGAPEAAADRAMSAGGSVIQPPYDLPVGRAVQLADPDGARFVTVHYADPTLIPDSELENWPPPAGHISWYAIGGSNPVDTATFYVAVIGYDEVETAATEEPAHMTLESGGEMRAGVFSTGGVLPPQWLIYVVVPDITAARERVIALGGQVATPVITIPGLGMIGGAADPTGALVFLHQPGT